jgi:hypothetical protein
MRGSSLGRLCFPIQVSSRRVGDLGMGEGISGQNSHSLSKATL